MRPKKNILFSVTPQKILFCYFGVPGWFFFDFRAKSTRDALYDGDRSFACRPRTFACRPQRRSQKVRRQKCQNFEFEKVLNYVFSLIAVVSHMCQGPGTEKNGA